MPFYSRANSQSHKKKYIYKVNVYNSIFKKRQWDRTMNNGQKQLFLNLLLEQVNEEHAFRHCGYYLSILWVSAMAGQNGQLVPR